MFIRVSHRMPNSLTNVNVRVLYIASYVRVIAEPDPETVARALGTLRLYTPRVDPQRVRFQIQTR